MTAHATALVEKILAKVQRVRALGHPIVRMTHLTTGFGVLFVKQWMQPERIQAVGLHRARRRAAVAAVTSRAAEFFRIVNLQQLFARMADERRGQIVD